MRYQIQNVFTQIGRTGLNDLLSLIALAFFTLLLNAFLFNHTSIYKELDLKETVPQLIAFLNDTIIEDDARVFADQIQKKDRILYIEYISKEEYHNRAEKQYGPLDGFIKKGFSDSNPYPASFEIYVDPVDVSRKTLEEISFDIESNAEIDDVVFTGYGIIMDLFRQTNRMTIASIAITSLLILLIIRAAVLKTARTRDEEIHLLNLIGTTRVYLSIPFLIQGIYLGCFGTLLGITCFYLLYCLFTFQLGVLEYLPYYQLITIAAVGVVIGLFAGILAQRKYIKSYRKNL